VLTRLSRKRLAQPSISRTHKANDVNHTLKAHLSRTVRHLRAFQILPGDPSSTVVLHVPHSSTSIPAHVRAGIVLTDEDLATELAAITDGDTDLMAVGAAAVAEVTPWLFVNRASRLVIDPERFPDEREELNAVGMGAVYERTTTGAVLRRPTATERTALLDEFYTPYASAMAALVRSRLTAVGRVTIIDVHSYPVVKLPYELAGDGPRPEVCVGTDPFHTSPELARAATSAMTTAAPTGEVGANSPFTGTYVPLDQYQQNPAVESVMLEIRRDVVRDHQDALIAAIAGLVNSRTAF
jgi:N-formylglutamate deformylase